MTRSIAITLSLLASGFVSCGSGGGDDSTTTTGSPPHAAYLTFSSDASASTTVVDGGATGQVNIPSNTPFAMEALDSTGWSFHWASDDVAAIVYPLSSITSNMSSYAATIFAEAPALYVVEVTFSDESVATLEISITSGGTCDDVDCSGAGDCGMNAALFPVCGCDYPYYANGFECLFVGSCIAEDESACIDYVGPLWDSSDGCAEYHTFSTLPCSTPDDAVLLGTCSAADPDNPGAWYLVWYYSPEYSQDEAEDNCTAEHSGYWDAVE